MYSQVSIYYIVADNYSHILNKRNLSQDTTKMVLEHGLEIHISYVDKPSNSLFICMNRALIALHYIVQIKFFMH